MGPFYFAPDGALYENPWTWNKNASIFYVEQPVGVGFSYSDDVTDYIENNGDQRAAHDNYYAILSFFEKFPQYKTNDFYISGESYGGHYIPTLTETILDLNTDGALNFKGFMVGNPFVDPWSDFQVTFYQEMYARGLIPQPLYAPFEQNCFDPLNYDAAFCEKLSVQMESLLGDGTNIYALDYPTCLLDSTSGTKEPRIRYGSAQVNKLLQHASRESTVLSGSRRLNVPNWLPNDVQYNPCAETWMTLYLNRNDVQEAIHVDNATAPLTWEECNESKGFAYSLQDFYTKMNYVYENLVAKAKAGSIDIKMLVYSGDDDAVCSTDSTQDWIWDLGAEPKEDFYWQIWQTTGETAGFVTAFNLGDATNSSFMFATVHGAGHEVPAYRPKAALNMFQNFVSGNWHGEN